PSSVGSRCHRLRRNPSSSRLPVASEIVDTLVTAPPLQTPRSTPRLSIPAKHPQPNTLSIA
ncbi:MAG: hypothetical protein ACK55I_17205, partial [bacterium]